MTIEDEDMYVPPVKVEKRIVEVVRESDGSIVSQVRIDTDNDRHQRTVVIDRPSRLLTPTVIRQRAKHLAELLEIEYREDLEWKCVALKKLKCRCPECVKEGRI